MIDFVVVGHLAFNQTQTSKGERETFGGAGYHVAFAAANILGPDRVGLISVCGGDFMDGLTGLAAVGVNLSGVKVVRSSPTDRFIINERSDGQRNFEAFGTLSPFLNDLVITKEYNGAQRFHLATAPPSQQINWLTKIRKTNPLALISSDTFELFVKQSPESTMQVVQGVDLMFANTVEWSGIPAIVKPIKILLLKEGAAGAQYFEKGELCYSVEAPRVEVVDTTGAGEIFAGTFLAMVIKGYSPRDALDIACKMASWSIRDFGVEHLLADREYSALLESLHYGGYSKERI